MRAFFPNAITQQSISVTPSRVDFIRPFTIFWYLPSPESRQRLYSPPSERQIIDKRWVAVCDAMSLLLISSRDLRAIVVEARYPRQGVRLTHRLGRSPSGRTYAAGGSGTRCWLRRRIPFGRARVRQSSPEVLSGMTRPSLHSARDDIRYRFSAYGDLPTSRVVQAKQCAAYLHSRTA